MIDARVLIIDDDKAQADTLRRVLALEGFQATSVYTPERALEECAQRMPDAIVSDYRLGRSTGLDLYAQIKKTHPEILFILVTAYGSLETAVAALKSGIYDFITKPLDMDELVIKLKKALKFKTLAVENTALKERLAKLKDGVSIIGSSTRMRDVMKMVDQIAQSAATVLIHGESGTGKELVAKALHTKSPRAGGPYVKVNCAAIPENLLEDELFGHEAGAFTSAVSQRKGKFEVASGGSIFLDEIGEMPIHLQSKILRVLQEKEFERIGGNEVLAADVRVITATNRDLAQMVKDGKFREDLYYRLNVIPIQLPALRERMEDVPELVEHFLRKFCEKNGRDVKGLSDAARNRLMSYSWPGNVRELENAMERAVVMARGDVLEPGDFVLSGEEKSNAVQAVLAQLLHTDLSLDELEKSLILMALGRCGGNVSQTARALGMTRRTLQYRLEKIRGGDPGEPPPDDHE